MYMYISIVGPRFFPKADVSYSPGFPEEGHGFSRVMVHDRLSSLSRDNSFHSSFA